MQVRQMTIEQAIHAGEQGAMHASHRADAANASWTEQATVLFGFYAREIAERQPFLTEDARDWATNAGLPPPPDCRSWGVVPRVAERAGAVRPCGFGRARTSNGSPKVLWQAA